MKGIKFKYIYFLLLLIAFFLSVIEPILNSPNLILLSINIAYRIGVLVILYALGNYLYYYWKFKNVFVKLTTIITIIVILMYSLLIFAPSLIQPGNNLYMPLSEVQGYKSNIFTNDCIYGNITRGNIKWYERHGCDNTKEEK